MEDRPLEGRPLEELTPEEMREIIRRVRANGGSDHAQMKKEIKRERAATVNEQSEGDGEIEIAEERRRKRFRTGEGQNGGEPLIDLSGDN